MPTLYVENVPDDLYQAIRSRAQANRSSISAEVLAILSQSVPTPAELERRKLFLAQALRIQSHPPRKRGAFPSTEEMQREDRER